MPWLDKAKFTIKNVTGGNNHGFWTRAHEARLQLFNDSLTT